MGFLTQKKIARVTIVYWFLLLYIIAALIWWFISLEKQNINLAAYKRQDLITKIDSTQNPSAYKKALVRIESEKKRSSTKYMLEGITFMILLLIGAVFVYQAVRRQFKNHQQQQNFMMAITHEFKTPIAVTKLNLETLQKHQLDEPKRMKLLEMTIQETDRLNTLTNNILVSSQLEREGYSELKEELNLTDLLRSSIEDFIQRFPKRTWEKDIEEDIEITADALLLKILVNNLIENALKYSPKNKPVLCMLHKKGKNIVLSVTDEGKGIADNEKKKIFDKFYRIGNEATRTAKGTGLGLYLCKKIAEDHSADIYVTDNRPSGCIFTVRFKLG